MLLFVLMVLKKRRSVSIWREIGAMKSQTITIAVLVAAGVALFVASKSSYDSLSRTRDQFYESRITQTEIYRVARGTYEAAIEEDGVTRLCQTAQGVDCNL